MGLFDQNELNDVKGYLQPEINKTEKPKTNSTPKKTSQNKKTQNTLPLSDCVVPASNFGGLFEGVQVNVIDNRKEDVTQEQEATNKEKTPAPEEKTQATQANKNPNVSEKPEQPKEDNLVSPNLTQAQKPNDTSSNPLNTTFTPSLSNKEQVNEAKAVKIRNIFINPALSEKEVKELTGKAERLKSQIERLEISQENLWKDPINFGTEQKKIYGGDGYRRGLVISSSISYNDARIARENTEFNLNSERSRKKFEYERIYNKLLQNKEYSKEEIAKKFNLDLEADKKLILQLQIKNAIKNPGKLREIISELHSENLELSDVTDIDDLKNFVKTHLRDSLFSVDYIDTAKCLNQSAMMLFVNDDLVEQILKEDKDKIQNIFNDCMCSQYGYYETIDFFEFITNSKYAKDEIFTKEFLHEQIASFIQKFIDKAARYSFDQSAEDNDRCNKKIKEYSSKLTTFFGISSEEIKDIIKKQLVKNSNIIEPILLDKESIKAYNSLRFLKFALNVEFSELKKLIEPSMNETFISIFNTYKSELSKDSSRKLPTIQKLIKLSDEIKDNQLDSKEASAIQDEITNIVKTYWNEKVNDNISFYNKICILEKISNFIGTEHTEELTSAYENAIKFYSTNATQYNYRDIHFREIVERLNKLNIFPDFEERVNYLHKFESTLANLLGKPNSYEDKTKGLQNLISEYKKDFSTKELSDRLFFYFSSDLEYGFTGNASIIIPTLNKLDHTYFRENKSELIPILKKAYKKYSDESSQKKYSNFSKKASFLEKFISRNFNEDEQKNIMGR